MSDGHDHDRSAPWIAEQYPRDGDTFGDPEIEVHHDPASETITFAPSDPADGTATTAWITAESDAVVDLTELR
jgi:hypothetical protein